MDQMDIPSSFQVYVCYSLYCFVNELVLGIANSHILKREGLPGISICISDEQQ